MQPVSLSGSVRRHQGFMEIPSLRQLLETESLHTRSLWEFVDLLHRELPPFFTLYEYD